MGFCLGRAEECVTVHMWSFSRVTLRHMRIPCKLTHTSGMKDFLRNTWNRWPEIWQAWCRSVGWGVHITELSKDRPCVSMRATEGASAGKFLSPDALNCFWLSLSGLRRNNKTSPVKTYSFVSLCKLPCLDCSVQ